MAAETTLKTLPPPRPAALLPQKPASKATWLSPDNEPMQDMIKVPEHRPSLLVYVRTQAGYVQALEIDRDGDSLFGKGEVARDLTEILSDAIAKKITIECKAEAVPSLSKADSESIAYIREAAEARKKLDEFSVAVIVVAMVLGSFAWLAFAILNRMRNR